MMVISMNSANCYTEIADDTVEMKTIEDVKKKLQEINEHIKKEQNSLKFQYRIGQRDILKWVLEE
jgi:hypothetical protein